MQPSLKSVLKALTPVMALPALIGSCDGANEASSHRRASADTAFVHNIRPRVQDTLVPREVFRIGTRDGPLEYTFGTIVAFTVAPSGHVYVQDVRSAVREFDETGAFVRYVARRGRGPGEVTTLNGLSASDDGRIAFSMT